tara:strand:- start:6821 stop:8983 length:2163 start_codon:yes stop_codon:yes gene_type:complete
MAYGVKYRLEFSDVLGFGKKVEIFKKDYVGDVLPMIGGANPLTISWQSSNDFYKPIIGSKCQLSLFVTDEVSYDDFYKFDEREYKVVVYYPQTQSGLYSDRVSDDGGNIESIECVESKIDENLVTSTNFRRNVLNDGGFFESIECLSSKITDEKNVIWSEYWSGFLVVDRYKEKMISPPFAVTFNAFDGLGTLNNFNSSIGYNNNNAPVNKTNLERISEILQNLDLDLDIYIASDIKFRTFGPVTTSEYEDITTLDVGFDEMIGEYGLRTAKDQLELILKQFNLRIYQSYNKWYIVEVTNIFDYYVKDIIYNEVQSGTTSTNIREKILTQYESTSQEYIDFRTFNYLGASIGKERQQVLYDNKNDLKAINNNLSREYLQGASEIHTVGSYLKTRNAFYNSGFEYGNYGFDILTDLSLNPYAEIATDEISFKGRRSMKLTDIAPISGFTQMFQFTTEVFNPQEVKYADFSCKLKYYFSFLNSQNSNVSAIFQYSIFTVLGSTGYFWDAASGKFSSTYGGTNLITTTTPNKWVDLSISLSDTDLNIGTDTTATIKFVISNTKCSDADYDTTYYDNMQILQSKTSADQSNQTFIAKLTNTGVNTTIKTINRIPDQKAGYFRTREANPSATFKPNSIDLMTVLNRNVANDYRDFITRYNGTFRNLKREPLSIHNKIWFSWPGIETDPQSTIIDGLTYNVKNAEFNVNAHLPNNDDDTPTTNIIN